MIRKHKEQDLEQIMSVWYEASLLAHPFLKNQFVEKVEADMRNLYIPNSQTWVFVQNKSIVGFISMIEKEIGGLFVLPDYHSQGIGTKLVDFVAKEHQVLEVEVFEKNTIGRGFYDKYGFKLIKRFTHKESGNIVLRSRSQ